MHGLSSFADPAIDSRDGRLGSGARGRARGRRRASADQLDRRRRPRLAGHERHVGRRPTAPARDDPSARRQWEHAVGSLRRRRADRLRPRVVRRRSGRRTAHPLPHAGDATAIAGTTAWGMRSNSRSGRSAWSKASRWSAGRSIRCCRCNAHFNLTKLGASADAFLPNFYGDMTDALNRGERSDRLKVRWDLEHATAGPADDRGSEVLGRRGDDPSMPAPTEVRPPLDAPGADPYPARVPRAARSGPRAGRCLARRDRGGLHGVLRRRAGRTRDSRQTPRT